MGQNLVDNRKQTLLTIDDERENWDINCHVIPYYTMLTFHSKLLTHVCSKYIFKIFMKAEG